MEYNQIEKNTIKQEPVNYYNLTDPLRKLKELTEQELNKLNQERRSMESIHSNLDLLIKRYNLEESYFGQIATWYGAKPWWVKILLFILVAGLGAGIGLLCHMPIILALVFGITYIFFAFFFINHYNTTLKQTKKLCEDIIEIEKNLTETINHFNELSNSLKKIIIDMHEFNTQMLTDMQTFQGSINILTAQVTKYQLIIEELNTAKESIVTTTTKVREELEAGDKQYKECCAIVSQQASQINLICNDITNNNHSLKFDSSKLQIATEKYQQTTARIIEIANSIENLLAHKKSIRLSPSQHTVENRPAQKPADVNAIGYQERNARIVNEDSDKCHITPNYEHNTEASLTCTVISLANHRGEQEILDLNTNILAEAKQARENSYKVLERLTTLQNTNHMDYT